jgi:hypothetical protein
MYGLLECTTARAAEVNVIPRPVLAGKVPGLLHLVPKTSPAIGYDATKGELAVDTETVLELNEIPVALEAGNEAGLDHFVPNTSPAVG